MTVLRVDHVVYAVEDLEAGGEWFLEEFGLASVAGGRHPGWGTANRIVPLGEDYLELVAVADEAEAEASDFGRAVIRAVSNGGGLAGWAVATDDLAAIADRLELELAHGSRNRPDGSVLRWELAGVTRALSTGALPFFIQWDCPPGSHPGAAPADHSVEPHGIAWVAVTAEEEPLRQWLGDAELPLRVDAGPQAITAVAVATARGEIVLR
jgi:hypothetical protein